MFNLMSDIFTTILEYITMYYSSTTYSYISSTCNSATASAADLAIRRVLPVLVHCTPSHTASGRLHYQWPSARVGQPPPSPPRLAGPSRYYYY